MEDIQEILSLIPSPSEEDKALVKKAYAFAKEAHKDQVRKSGEPYFTHLFATAKNLAELEMGAVTVSAGFLHDSIEDVGVTGETLEKEFGKEIRFLVEGVTKLGQLKYRGTERYNESLRKLFVAMSQDIRVLVIKLADRLHNMRTLHFVPQEKQLRIAKETLEIYAPLAYRLGIRKLHRELEDLSFAYVYPEDYEKMLKLLKNKRSEEEEMLEKFNKSLKKEFAKNNITDFAVDYRVKGLYSLYKKLKRKDMDVDKVYDLLAMRVIVPTIGDCYRILGIIHSGWRPLPGRIKDYIAFPKPNGYQSIHTTVLNGFGGVIEVQIKTKEMQRESEYGITSHISYKQQDGKKKITNPSLLWVKKILPVRDNFDASANKTSKKINFDDVPRWVKELVEYQKDAGASDSVIDEIKSDFFEERIFVFTPKGDVIDLPKDSTAIDFAYNIHSDVGNHISGAKINGKFVAITTTLQNGDLVEAETRPNSKPSRKWLEVVKTTIAKKHIRSSLEERRGK
ncbi:MAG: HD domain-containing protein [Candidatus Zambryskibacteria bacterium]|nr:HD domain-containing protein [Candidatus Zambryskibacteria bacterium]